MSFAETGASSMSRPLLEDPGPLPVLLSTVICSKRLCLHVARTFGTQLCTHTPTSKPNADLIGSLLWYLLFVIEQCQEGLVVPLQDEVVTIYIRVKPCHAHHTRQTFLLNLQVLLFPPRSVCVTWMPPASPHHPDTCVTKPYSEASQAKRISTFGSKWANTCNDTNCSLALSGAYEPPWREGAVN